MCVLFCCYVISVCSVCVVVVILCIVVNVFGCVIFFCGKYIICLDIIYIDGVEVVVIVY